MTLNSKKRAPKWRYRVFLNGKEIHGVWYVDVRRGVIRTYDAYDKGEQGAVLTEEGSVMSKELRGRVVLSRIDRNSARARQRINWAKSRRRKR